ncbi:hypothetical protein GCM10009547_35250 [Sporichthya brevicatena]|uniref:Uncharacterized protein n=1 Tax=Sporichthya brevicatena TaxID=171442 RepID=A0ABN1H471_9ACTN
MLTELSQLIAIGEVQIDTRSGRAREAGPLQTVSQLIDAATGKVLGPGALKMKVSSEGPTDPRACVKSGNNKRVTAYSPSNRMIVGKDGTVHFQYHAYRLGQARLLESGLSTQWEVCSVGGGDFDSARLRRVGTGIAMADSSHIWRIGQAWQTGSTPESYALNLGFQVKRGPVSINASLKQQPADKLLGSFRAPFRSGLDAYEHNAVYAWWQDNCIGRWWKCWKNSGSKDFQGSIAHALWEFPEGEEPAVVGLYYTAYATYA